MAESDYSLYELVAGKLDKSEIVELLKQNADIFAQKAALETTIKEQADQIYMLNKQVEEQAAQISKLNEQLTDSKRDAEILRKALKDADHRIAERDAGKISNQKVSEACRLYRKGDYNGAIRLCNEALKFNPNDDKAYLQRGDAYIELGQFKQAKQDYDKANQLKHK